MSGVLHQNNFDSQVYVKYKGKGTSRAWSKFDSHQNINCEFKKKANIVETIYFTFI